MNMYYNTNQCKKDHSLEKTNNRRKMAAWLTSWVFLGFFVCLCSVLFFNLFESQRSAQRMAVMTSL